MIAMRSANYSCNPGCTVGYIADGQPCGGPATRVAFVPRLWRPPREVHRRRRV